LSAPEDMILESDMGSARVGGGACCSGELGERASREFTYLFLEGRPPGIVCGRLHGASVH
jgi:hypothetical protein